MESLTSEGVSGVSARHQLACTRVALESLTFSYASLDRDPDGAPDTLQATVTFTPGELPKLSLPPGNPHLRIADSGPGVGAEALESIFTPFTRLNESNTKGLGLGMAVALGLCRAMGIELSAEPTPGGGFTAVLTIPFRDGAPLKSGTARQDGAGLTGREEAP